MTDDAPIIRPEKLEALRKKLELKHERRRRARAILTPKKKAPWWKRLFGSG
jgi:hypothetical protein